VFTLQHYPLNTLLLWFLNHGVGLVVSVLRSDGKINCFHATLLDLARSHFMTHVCRFLKEFYWKKASITRLYWHCSNITVRYLAHGRSYCILHFFNSSG